LRNGSCRGKGKKKSGYQKGLRGRRVKLFSSERKRALGKKGIVNKREEGTLNKEAHDITKDLTAPSSAKIVVSEYTNCSGEVDREFKAQTVRIARLLKRHQGERVVVSRSRLHGDRRIRATVADPYEWLREREILKVESR
jgi:hypothetical protein